MKLSSHHIAISVANLDRSIAFYEKLGFTKVHRYDDDKKTNIHLALADFYLEIFCFKQNEAAEPLTYNYLATLETSGLKHFALKTDDAYATLSELQRMGLTDEQTIIDDSVANLQFFFIHDPDGIWLEIINDRRY